jgi:hypothetical protein
MVLLSPPQTPARFGIARFGGARFGYVYVLACAHWLNVTIVAPVWTAVDPCRNTGA